MPKQDVVAGTDIRLKAVDIVRTFPGVKALDGVQLSVRKGEVHALVGENGAGKSTLMNVLSGVLKPDSGKIYLDGEEIELHNPKDANEKGISIAHQEMSLIPGLSIAENIFANRQPTRKLSFINSKELNDMTKVLLDKFDMGYIDPNTLVKKLSVGQRQIIEILKAISANPKLLILDEPTSSLTEAEGKELFENIRKLKAEGMSIIYISHHMEEIFELADAVTVFRDGKYICDARVSDIDENYLVSKMVGREISNVYGERTVDFSDEVIFEAKNLTTRGRFNDVSFQVKKGEIVGMYGLVGAGRSETARAIVGIDKLEKGEIFVNGQKVVVKSVSSAIKNGIGYLSEDRKDDGLFLEMPIRDNLVANHLYDFANGGMMNNKMIEEFGENARKEFNIVCSSLDQKIGNLSGGNQQKVLCGMWFGIKPNFLILDEPTRGVDIGAKSEIYSLIRDLAAQGVSVLVISSDLPEVLGISDRIIVMKEGSVVGELSRSEFTEESVVAAAAGID